MLNNPWMLGGSPMTQISNQTDGLGGSGHMVVQTQSVSISSSDGSVIHQTNTYESWVTLSGQQPMNLDMMPSAGLGPNLINSLDMTGTSAINSRGSDTYLALPMASEAMPASGPPVAVSMHNPFAAHNQVEPVVALPTQMAVTESPLMATMQNPAETFIALPVPPVCDPLVAVPTVQNLYNPLLGASDSSVPLIPTSAQQTNQTNVPSWYLVVQDVPESTPAINGLVGSPSVVRTDDDLFLCLRCNSTFEKVSCVDWHLTECKGSGVKTSVAPVINTPSTTTVAVKTLQCSLCGRFFNIFNDTSNPFICSDCCANSVPFAFPFGMQCVRQFRCSECTESFQFESQLEDHLNSHKSSVTICELPDNYTEENGNEEDNSSPIVEPMVEPPEDEGSASFETGSSDDEPEQSVSESCGECGDSFSSCESLYEHYKSHDDVQSYSCTKCGIICVGRYSLKKHMWAHTREIEEKEDMADSCFEEQEEDTKDGLVSQPFGCTECGMQFSDSNELKEHCVSHLRSKPFLCTQCGEKFETTSTLERHWEAHAFEME